MGSLRLIAHACVSFFLFSTAAAFTDQAFAAGNSAKVDITGSIPSVCSFTTTPTNTSLGELVSGSVTSLGNFGFTCNLGVSSAVNLTVQSANGALKRDGGSETVAYQVVWNIQGNAAASGDPAAWLAPIGFTLSSGLNGVEQLGDFSVRVTGPTTGLTAGTYKDTITYTIAP